MIRAPIGFGKLATMRGLVLAVLLVFLIIFVLQPHVSFSGYPGDLTPIYAFGQQDSQIEDKDADKVNNEESENVEAPEEKPLQWEKPRFEERKDERERMVQEQIAARDVENESTLAAMRHVPRHLFVPAQYAGRAYADCPLPIGQGQTISQPFIVAFMTEVLEVEPGDKVLEIGTGSGYQAAVLTELTPYVYTIEIIKELGEQVVERLEKLGYGTVSAKIDDGYFGWVEHAPFDGIIVTCAAGHVPPPLLRQLKPGGRMVIPVGGIYEVQYLMCVTKSEEGKIRSQRLLLVRFVPMTGRTQTGG